MSNMLFPSLYLTTLPPPPLPFPTLCPLALPLLPCPCPFAPFAPCLCSPFAPTCLPLPLPPLPHLPLHTFYPTPMEDFGEKLEAQVSGEWAFSVYLNIEGQVCPWTMAASPSRWVWKNYSCLLLLYQCALLPIPNIYSCCLNSVCVYYT